jgi:hypothetical protein
MTIGLLCLFPGSSKSFLLSRMSIHALGPTQPPIQWAPEAICLGVKLLGCGAEFSAVVFSQKSYIISLKRALCVCQSVVMHDHMLVSKMYWRMS